MDGNKESFLWDLHIEMFFLPLFFHYTRTTSKVALCSMCGSYSELKHFPCLHVFYLQKSRNLHFAEDVLFDTFMNFHIFTSF